MNAYESIQRVVDEIEARIDSGQSLDGVCKVSGFSITHCYRLFHSLCGRSVKEYARLRFLAKSVTLLTGTSMPIAEISMECGYESQEAFTRAFKAELGATPGKVRSGKVQVFPLGKINLFEKYFDKVANTFYPDPKIKVIKSLPEMRVVTFRRESAHPEREALSMAHEWVAANGLLSHPFRIFGFDNPSPEKGKPIYGYEVWVTLPEGFVANGIATKLIPAQTFAVIHTVLSEIEISWRHFVSWLKLSKYEYRGGNCLEEHLSDFEDIGKKDIGLDLYMPIRESRIFVEDRKEKAMSDIFEADFERCEMATYCHKSASPEGDGWKVIDNWVRENKLLGPDAFVLGFDNPSPDGKNPIYGYEYWVKIPDGLDVPPPLVRKEFKGGHFACLNSDVPHVGMDWKRLVRWVEDNGKKWRGCDCFEQSLIQENKGDEIKLLLMLPIEA